MSMDFDVIIVGGRPAGASLAARLGARGVRVLIVDRSVFPSLPGVPSSPILFPSGVRMLEAIGIAEESYADPRAKMRGIGVELGEHFATRMSVPAMSCGRDYFYGLDREVFDELLWDNLARFPSVERRQGFRVVDLLCEGDRVIGIVGEPGGAEGPAGFEEIRARCVVGADGRYSLVARRVGAEVYEARDDHTSTVYYADWEGVDAGDFEDPWAHIYTDARGLDIISFAMPGGRTSINTHTRSDRTAINGDVERFYVDTLRSQPRVWRKLEGAERVSPIYGLKRISNAYRRASGPGWALCGDACHFKDPVDAQGIYDALLSTEALDRALAAALALDKPWEEAMADYESELWARTRPMFLSTTGRLKRELYGAPPVAVIKSLIRWRLSDPSYHRAFLRVLSREIDPATLTSPLGILASVGRGIAGDIAGLFGRRGRGAHRGSIEDPAARALARSQLPEPSGKTP